MTKVPAANHCVMTRLLLEGLASSVAGAGGAGVAFALLFSIMTAASDLAFFMRCTGQSRSFSNHFAISHSLGIFCRLMVGVGEVACCVVSAVWVSGRHFLRNKGVLLSQ